MIDNLLRKVLEWAVDRPNIHAIALVGSHARGAARPDSDVDLILLAERPQDFVANIEWLGTFGTVVRQVVEDWGRVTSVRAWYASGLEVEFGLASVEWATRPDEGTHRVLEGGACVLMDRAKVFAAFEDLLLRPRGEESHRR